MRNQKESSLGEIISKMMEEFRIKDKLDELSVGQIWEKAMGPVIARRTDSVFFKNGVLRIKISSAPLRSELMFQKNEIINLLNGELGENTVKEVQFD